MGSVTADAGAGTAVGEGSGPFVMASASPVQRCRRVFHERRAVAGVNALRDPS